MSVVHTSHTSHRSYGAALMLVSSLLAGAASAAEPSGPKPLPEGTVLENIDGRLVHADANAPWLFELTTDANSIAGAVRTGTRFELLPSAILGQLIADVNDRYAPLYRLSARVTLYNGNNFLFPSYYLPLSKLKEDPNGPDGQTPPPTGFVPPTTRPGDPNLPIPPEVLRKLQERRPPRAVQRSGSQPGSQKRPTQMLVDALGTISADAQGVFFTPNAFGWNVSHTQYRLLPCSVLEQAVRVQATTPDAIRFSIAGQVTEFKGTTYLLLERATRAYGYGNFGR